MRRTLGKAVRERGQTPARARIHPVGKRADTDNKEGGFSRPFQDISGKPQQDISRLTPEILDGLFQRAVEAQKIIAAWKQTMESAKSKDFGRSLVYLQEEMRRFARIRKLVIKQNARKSPRWMSPWERLWIDAFEELEEVIEAQLREAQYLLRQLSVFGRMERTDLILHPVVLQEFNRRSDSADPTVQNVAHRSRGFRICGRTSSLERR